jgi:hypothetical protein
MKVHRDQEARQTFAEAMQLAKMHRPNDQSKQITDLIAQFQQRSSEAESFAENTMAITKEFGRAPLQGGVGAAPVIRIKGKQTAVKIGHPSLIPESQPLFCECLPGR